MPDEGVDAEIGAPREEFDRLQRAFAGPAVEWILVTEPLQAVVAAPKLRQVCVHAHMALVVPEDQPDDPDRRPDEAEHSDPDGVRCGEPAALTFVIAVDVRDRHQADQQHRGHDDAG